jgi:hypothetical protein
MNDENYWQTRNTYISTARIKIVLFRYLNLEARGVSLLAEFSSILTGTFVGGGMSTVNLP